MSELSIEELRKLCRDDNIKWTTHTAERMKARNIDKYDVKAAIMSGEIIEQYPAAFPYPACLILGTAIDNGKIHVVVGYGDYRLHIVSVYRPSSELWESDLKTRKEVLK